MNNKKESFKFKNNFLIIFLAFLITGIFSGGIAGFYVSKYFISKNLKQSLITNNKLNQKTPDSIANKNSLQNEDQVVIKIVKDNSEAVVSVVVTKDIPKIDSFFNDPFFNQFYQNQKQKLETETREIGGGTGFIVDSSGFIITNKHVVDDESADYTIVMKNGERYKAEVLDKDSFLDVAILKIESEKLPILTFGDSDKLKVGQTVIAIGNSLGEFSNTVSKGIVSGLKREVEAGNSLGQIEILEEVIQTDAAINPGNSGGPLFDLNGKVIGINVAMAQGAENIGFTIPINQIKDIYQGVKETGRIVRPYLGIRYLLIDSKIQEMNALSVDYGALVLRGVSKGELAVIPGSPADKIGLTEYDIILEIDGEQITQKNGLAKIIRKKKVGNEVKLKIIHEGEEKILTATLEEADF